MCMRQLEFFSRSEVAAMRDPTRARNYSPGKAEFRRDHERRRRWGLKRRHGWKLCRSSGCSRTCGELGPHDTVESVPPLIWPEGATCVRPPEPAAAPVFEGLVEASVQAVPTDQTADNAVRTDTGQAEPREQRSHRAVRPRRPPGGVSNRRPAPTAPGPVSPHRRRRPARHHQPAAADVEPARARNTHRFMTDQAGPAAATHVESIRITTTRIHGPPM
jgi:hypothetical protein